MCSTLFKKRKDKHKPVGFMRQRKLGEEIGIIACGICDNTGCDYFDKEQGCLEAFVPDAVCPYGEK